MRYYVIADDGQRYGPADVGLLQQWVAEGRIRADHFLEPEMGGGRTPATTVPGLQFGLVNPINQPATMYQTHPYQQPYNAVPYSPYTVQGAMELRFAWLASILGLILTIGCNHIIGAILALAGVALASIAQRRGQRAGGPMAVAAVAIVIAAFVVFLGSAM